MAVLINAAAAAAAAWLALLPSPSINPLVHSVLLHDGLYRRMGPVLDVLLMHQPDPILARAIDVLLLLLLLPWHIHGCTLAA
jgi:hypothetical protein